MSRWVRFLYIMISTIFSCQSYLLSRRFLPNHGNKAFATRKVVGEMISKDLKQWRKQVATELQKPLYIVMRNAVIDEIARLMPTTKPGLLSISGVGAKTMTYADHLLNVVQARKNLITVGADESTENSVEEETFEKIRAPAKKRVQSAKASESCKIPFSDFVPPTTLISKDMLSLEKQRVVENILNGTSNVFISGSAGTGKSFLLKYLIQELRAKCGFEYVAVTAPTGVAAINVGGSTIHSFGGIGIGKGDPEHLLAAALSNKNAVKKWKKADVLIIDEISMVDAVLFDLLNSIAKAVRNSNRPFGGLRLLVVGDFLQLPPVCVSVGSAYVRSGSAQALLPAKQGNGFCFQSAAWAEAGFNNPGCRVVLQDIVRQADRQQVDILNRIRMGNVLSSDLEVLNQNCVALKPLPNDGIIPTKLYCVNKDVDAENAKNLADLPEDLVNVSAVDVWRLSGMNVSASGRSVPQLAASRKRVIEELANKFVPPVVSLKIGAQVMLLRNRNEDHVGLSKKPRDGSMVDDDPGQAEGDGSGDEEKSRLVNGSRGVVIGFVEPSVINDGGLIPVVRFDCGRVEKIGRVEFDVRGGPDEDWILTRYQIPLKLAWAITVHKSQGSTLSRAELMVSNAFAYGQTYVALSRVTSLAGLWLTRPLSRENILVHPAVLDFYGFK